MEIKSRWDDKVLYSGEAATLKDLVATAVEVGANLEGANLRGADLGCANLEGADLKCAYLRGANLVGADLRGANLVGANLRGADLGCANLRGANLVGANLRGADLGCANLEGADLRCANLEGADLKCANLSGAKINWNSHALISEILWRAAQENESREMLAAYIGQRTDWCWERWVEYKHPERDWAIEELREWVTEGEDAPEILRHVTPT